MGFWCGGFAGLVVDPGTRVILMLYYARKAPLLV
jgi:hypothetical protein